MKWSDDVTVKYFKPQRMDTDTKFESGKKYKGKTLYEVYVTRGDKNYIEYCMSRGFILVTKETIAKLRRLEKIKFEQEEKRALSNQELLRKRFGKQLESYGTYKNAFGNKKNHNKVYAILDGFGNVKIGYSQDPEARVLELQTGNASKLILADWIEGSYDTEHNLHHKLKEHRRQGEWFTLNTQVKEVLKKYGFKLE